MSDMSNEVAIRLLQTARDKAESAGLREAIDRGIKALEQEPCDMTAEQYRQRMMKAFHNADCSELIALCVLPTEKEFTHLEWLLKKEWRKEQEPYEECRSLKDIKELLEKKAYTLDGVPICDGGGACIGIYFSIANDLPPVQPKANWIPASEKLPDTDDEVLVTYIVNGNRKKRYVETAYYYPITDEWNSLNDEYRVPNTKVEIIAWQPLPKPYVVEPQESGETETWNGIHAQITAPKGTFDKIFNDTEEDIDDI